MPAVQIVKNMLSDEAFQSLRDYVIHSARHMGHYEPTFHRTVVQEPRVLTNMHKELAVFASNLSGRRLKPSYCIIANYLHEGMCPLHADQDLCFYTIDLLVSKDSDSPWPLMIGEKWTDEQWEMNGYKNPDIYSGDPSPEDIDVKWNEVNLQPNQAACYSGTHSWHYRPNKSNGRTDLVFFHFVAEDFDEEFN